MTDRTKMRLLILGAIVCFLIASLTACNSRVEVDERVHGQPLDANTVQEYDRPAWLPACLHAYKVTDRMSGQQWWLLEMDGTDSPTWVSLPIEEK